MFLHHKQQKTLTLLPRLEGFSFYQNTNTKGFYMIKDSITWIGSLKVKIYRAQCHYHASYVHFIRSEITTLLNSASKCHMLHAQTCQVVSQVRGSMINFRVELPHFFKRAILNPALKGKINDFYVSLIMHRVEGDI